MNALVGKDFMMYVTVSGVVKPVACATSMTIAITRELKEATKPGNSIWRQYYKGMASYTVSADGVYVYDSSVYSASEMIDNIMSNDSLSWVAKDESNSDIVLSGDVLMNTLSITSPADGHHTFSVGFTGDGALSKSGVVPGSDYLLLENGFRILKEDGSGYLIKE